MSDWNKIQKLPKYSFVDPLCRLLIAPWCFQHLYISLHISISKCFIYYGLIQSLFYFGRNLGRVIISNYNTSLNKSFFMLLLGISFLILGLTFRFIIMLISYFFIGLCCGIFKANSELETYHIITNQINQSSPKYILTISTIIIMIIIPLISSIIFTSSPQYEYHLFLPFIISSFISILISLRPDNGYNIIIKLCNKNKLNNNNISNNISKTNTNTISSIEQQELINKLDINTIIPTDKFLMLANNNVEKAKQLYYNTLKWRIENNINNIITTPQPYFYELLQYYPHYIHGRSKEKAVVCYEV